MRWHGVRRRRVLSGLRRLSHWPLWDTVAYEPPLPLHSPYTRYMAKYEGPCARCGVRVERIIRPGRERLCVPCAIRKAADHQRALAAGTHPDLEASRAAGAEIARQIEAREGPWYEKWRRGMAAAAER